MLRRDFLTYDEVVKRIGGDKESFRQTLLHEPFNAYVELIEIEGTYTLYDDEKEPASGHTHFAKWWRPFYSSRSVKEKEEDDGIQYTLTGWFVVDLFEMRGAARGKSTGFAWGTTVSPATNSGGEPPLLEAELNFDVARSFELSDFWFRASDIERMVQPEVPNTSDGSKPQKLRSDREQNLLRVIAGLWALSELPPEHNTTADKISALICGWGWDKPASGTIADTILREAANLPRIIQK